jgi:broad specificity phosphatase PhoE
MRRRKTVSVFFVRHGEAAHNVFEHGFHTRDNPLSAHGRKQAAACGLVLQACAQETPFDVAVISPMTRTIQTCLLSLKSMRDIEGSIPMPELKLEPDVAERHSGFLCDCGSPVEILQREFPTLDFAPVKQKEKQSPGTAAAAAAYALGYRQQANIETGEETAWWDAEEERLAVELQPERRGKKAGGVHDSRVARALSKRLEERINVQFKNGLEALLSRLPDKSRVLVYAHGGVYGLLLQQKFANCEIQQYDYECDEDGSRSNAEGWLRNRIRGWKDPAQVTS